MIRPTNVRQIKSSNKNK